MNRRSGLILGLVVLMVGGTSGFLCYVRDHQKLSRPGIKVIAEPIYGVHGQVVGAHSVYLPEKVLNYTSKAAPIDDKILDWLPKDTTYGQRLYQGADGFQAQMSVVLMGTDRTSIHRPQFCLPAQGWAIQKEDLTSIAIAQPHPYALPVMKLKARLEGRLPTGGTVSRGGIYVYWFVTDGQLTAQHGEYMWSILKHLLFKGELQRWAYVSCFAACLPGQEEAAYGRVRELIAAAVPQFQLAAGPPVAKADAERGDAETQRRGGKAAIQSASALATPKMMGASE